MRIVSWNVNGIRAVHKKELFHPFLEALQPDVVCLQEIKSQEHEFDGDLSEFDAHWHPAEKKGYSGTAIFSKPRPLSVTKGMPKAIIDKYDLTNDDFGDVSSEGRVVTAEYDDFYLVTVYTPNAKGDLGRLKLRHEKWDPAFLAYVKKLEKTKPVIFCGDLNVAHQPDDLANPKPNEGKAGYTDEERYGFEQFLAAGFVDTFRMFTSGNGHYTWWSYVTGARARNAGWRIDYFLVSEALKDRVIAAEIHADIMGSDHCPVSITLAD